MDEEQFAEDVADHFPLGWGAAPPLLPRAPFPEPELLARAAASICAAPSAAERRKAERRRPEVMWSRVYNALLADMRAKNQMWAFVYLHPHGIEDNDLEWWE